MEHPTLNKVAAVLTYQSYKTGQYWLMYTNSRTGLGEIHTSSSWFAIAIAMSCAHLAGGILLLSRWTAAFSLNCYEDKFNKDQLLSQYEYTCIWVCIWYFKPYSYIQFTNIFFNYFLLTIWWQSCQVVLVTYWNKTE